MKRFSFGNLLVDNDNREAVQVCQDLAERRPVSPQPILLVGEPGSGKTHLLYAIVEHIRKEYEPGETRYAILNPRKLPAEVRAQVRELVREPAPVKSAKFALLLVDQFEAYSEETDELEALVRVFLESGHPAILASDVELDRLAISDTFRALLANGKIVAVAPVESAPGALEQRVRQTHEDELERQRREVEAQRFLSDTAQETAQWRQRNEELKTEAADLRTQVQVARAMSKSLERQLEDMRLALYEARSAPPPEEPLQAELARVQAELDRSAEEIRGLKETVAQREAASAADAQALRAELTSVRQALQSAEVRAETAERSQHEASASRDALGMDQFRLENELAAARGELERVTAQLRATEEEKSQSLHERVRLENDLRTLRERMDQANAAAQAADEERIRLAAQIEVASAECADLKTRLAEEQDGVHALVEQERRAAQAQIEAQREVAARSDEEARTRIEAIEAELAEARVQSDERCAESEGLVERARRLVEQIDANRIRFAEVETEQLRRIEELERALEDRAVTVASAEELAKVQGEAQEALARLGALQARFDTERAQLQEAVRETRERMEADAVRGEEEARRTAETESLRRESHEQSLAAGARIRELEEQIETVQRDAQERVKAATARARETAQRFEAARNSLTEQLQGVNEILAGATGLLHRATECWIEADTPDPGELIHSQRPDEEPGAIEGSNSPSESFFPKTEAVTAMNSEEEDDWTSGPEPES